MAGLRERLARAKEASPADGADVTGGPATEAAGETAMVSEAARESGNQTAGAKLQEFDPAVVE